MCVEGMFSSDYELIKMQLDVIEHLKKVVEEHETKLNWLSTQIALMKEEALDN